MKRKIAVVSISIICVLLLAFIGYTALSSATEQKRNELTLIENPRDVYANAASKINPTQDLVLHVSVTKETTVDNSVFLEVFEQSVQFDVHPSGEKRILLHETITSGSHSIEVTEVFYDNVVYVSIDDTPFKSECSADDYCATLYPAAILTEQLYNNIGGIDNGEDYIIHFSEPLGIESWLDNQSASLQNARGTAIISYDGSLKSSMYTASYQENGIIFRTTVHVDIEHKNTDVVLPKDIETYTQIAYWKGPKTLERACGFLLQADRVSSTYSDSIYFQAFGDLRMQNIALHAYKDSQWSVSISTEINLKNDTKQDHEITHTKKELFLDNQYTISTDSNTFVNNTEITVDTVYDYFQDQLVSTLILPQHIDSAQIVENKNTLRINFTGTDSFGNFLAENVCRILYNAPELLAETGATLSIKELQCYLEIDKCSGLPVATGINFLGDYKAEGLPYRIQYSAEQSYKIPSDTAKSEIETAAE